MAGNPVNDLAILIYPVTAIFSAHYVDDLAVDGIDVTFTNTDCTVVSDHLVYNTYTSTSGLNTLTVTAYGHQYVISPLNDDTTVNLPTQNLYAWTCSSPSATFWTDTDNPTTLSHIYDSNGNDVTSTYIHGENLIESASSSSIIYAAGVGTYIPIGVYSGGIIR